MPLISLDNVTIAYGHLPLLDQVVLRVEPRERIAIIGRNGSGKSTLMNIINGAAVPDSGTVWRQPGGPNRAAGAGRAAVGQPARLRCRR